MAASYSILTPQPEAGSGGTNPEFNRFTRHPAAATGSWDRESLCGCDILPVCVSRCLRVSFFLWDILGHFGTSSVRPRSRVNACFFFRGVISCHFVPFCAPCRASPDCARSPRWTVTKPAGGWRRQQVGGRVSAFSRTGASPPPAPRFGRPATGVSGSFPMVIGVVKVGRWPVESNRPRAGPSVARTLASLSILTVRSCPLAWMERRLFSASTSLMVPTTSKAGEGMAMRRRVSVGLGRVGAWGLRNNDSRVDGMKDYFLCACLRSSVEVALRLG
jgi:hypothetical protein